MEKEEKKHGRELAAPTVSARDAQASPVALLTIALLGGVGYFAWRFWKDFRDKNDAVSRAIRGDTTGLQKTEAADGKPKSKGSPFTFDKQPGAGNINTRGRPEVSASHGRSRHDPKPKSQKQLRKEAKQAKKATREQAARDAEATQLSAVIAKRAKEVGLGPQLPEEPAKQHYVDYEGVTRGYDKIVEWQQTGKKKY